MAEAATAFPKRNRAGESLPRLPKADVEEVSAFPSRRRNSTNTEGNESPASKNSQRGAAEEPTAFPRKRSPQSHETPSTPTSNSILAGSGNSEVPSAFPSKSRAPPMSENDKHLLASKGSPIAQEEEASAFPSRRRQNASPRASGGEESTAFPAKRKAHVGFANMEAQKQSREAKKRTFHQSLTNRGVFEHLNNILVEFYENVDARDHPHEYIQHYFTCLSGTDYNALCKDNNDLRDQIEAKKRKLQELQIKLNASKAQPL